MKILANHQSETTEDNAYIYRKFATSNCWLSENVWGKRPDKKKSKKERKNTTERKKTGITRSGRIGDDRLMSLKTTQKRKEKEEKRAEEKKDT